jgi:HK97 gp10 family phage protein
MIKMSVTIVDADKVISALKKLSDDINNASRLFMMQEGAEMESEIKNSMKTGGRLSSKGARGGKQRIHSQPNQPPFVQTGNLRASIGYLLSKEGKNNLFLDIGAIRKAKIEVTYAKALELGTSKMAPRPYLMPVIKRHIDKWEKEIGIRIDKLKIK